MQNREYKGEKFGNEDQVDLHRASEGLLSFEEMRARRAFDEATKEVLRLVRHELIQSDSSERPIPLPQPTEPREQIAATSEGMVHMREQHKMGSLNGEMNPQVSWMDASNAPQSMRRAA